MWDLHIFKTHVLKHKRHKFKYTPDDRIKKLKIKCENAKTLSEYKSSVYKYTSLICNVTIIILATLTTFISSLNYLSQCTGNYNKTLIAFGACTTIIKSMQMIFNFEKKSVEFKKTSIKIHKLLREINDFDTALETSTILQKINSFEEQLDEYEFNLFLDGLNDE